jgi:flagellar biosynthesis/type III secretory pathway M-ring protein FliF/YscJ
VEIDYDEVELSTKSVGLEQIERFIDKDAGAVAQLLRNWLTDD